MLPVSKLCPLCYGIDAESIRTVEDLRELVGKLRTHYPEWRPGQAWFNALHRVRPHLADRVRGGNLDPFHNDKRIRTLQAWLNLHWSDPA